MEEKTYCNVFAGEEEVTQRTTTPLEQEHLIIPDIPVFSVPGQNGSGSVGASTAAPTDEIIPWCPSPEPLQRSTTRKRARAPLVNKAANAKKARQRLRKRGPLPVPVMKRSRRSVMNASTATSDMTMPMSSASAPSTPKTPRGKAVAKKRPSATAPKSNHRVIKLSPGMISMPQRFIVTIEPLK